MSDDVKTRGQGRLGCLLVLAVLVFLLVVAPIVTVLVWTSQSARRAQVEIDRLSASGQPVSGADLDTFYAPEDGVQDITMAWLSPLRDLDNPAFTQAAAKLPILGDGDDIPPVGHPWNQLNDSRQWLDQVKDPVSRFHEAAGLRGSVRYPVKLSAGVAALLPHVQKVRLGARALALESEVNAHQGDAAATVKSIRTGLSLAKTLEREPIFVSQLVRFAVDGVMLDQIQRHLGPLDFDDEVLEQLQDQLRATDYSRAMPLGLTGERAMGIQAMRNPAGAGLAKGNNALWTRTRGEDTQYMLKIYQQLLAVAHLPFYKSVDTLDDIESKMRGKVSTPLGKARFALTSMLLPSFKAMFRAHARTQAMRRAAETAVAIKRFQQQQGRLPKNLVELVPEFMSSAPVDPFDGKPLRYVVEGDDFSVYSVGYNQADDGGIHDAARTDVVFRVRKKPPVEEPPVEEPPVEEPQQEAP